MRIGFQENGEKFYFHELNQSKELPTIETLKEDRKKFNNYFKLNQSNQINFLSAFASFLNAKYGTEFKVNSPVQILKKRYNLFFATLKFL